MLYSIHREMCEKNRSNRAIYFAELSQILDFSPICCYSLNYLHGQMLYEIYEVKHGLYIPEVRRESANFFL